MDEKTSAKFRLAEAQAARIQRRMRQIYDSRLNLDTKAKLNAFKRQALEIDRLQAKFEEVVEEMNLLQAVANPSFQPDLQSLDAFSDMYYAVKDLLRVTEGETSGRMSGPSTEGDEARPKLPKIELMEFDGDPLKWPAFYETFKNLIHENTTLSPVSKLYYLMGKLKGKALAVCAGILPTPENYKVLWDTLVRKYEDKRTLARAYLSQILEFKPLSHESVEHLNHFIERIDVAVNSLRQLRLDDLGDYILTSICLSKVDVQTRVAFERSLEKNEFPSYDRLSEFVKDQCQILTRAADGPSKLSNRLAKSMNFKSFAVSEKTSPSGDRQGNGCPYCKNTLHRLHKCPKFLGLSHAERKRFVFKNSLCFNCLKSGHAGKECKSTFSCSHCQQNHHSVLHVEESQREKPNEPTPGEKPVALVSRGDDDKVQQTVLLSTAVVWAKSRSGERVPMRVLLDSASQCHFMTTQFCRRLKLSVNPLATSVSGIGSEVKPVTGQVTFTFRSRYKPGDYKIHAWVIDKVTDNLPSLGVDPKIHELLKGRQLADDSFATPGGIDGIVGAELVPMLLGPGRPLGQGWPMVLESPLGIIVMGKAPIQTIAAENQVFCCTNLNELLLKFWELEKVEDTPLQDPDDVTCEQLFTNSVRREGDGRYTVALPFQEYPPRLGNSFEMALRRFLSLERKFSRFPDFGRKYGEVIQDYLSQGHMELAPTKPEALSYYIPHHGIVKTSSASTPLRVVFDASAPSTNGKSLNDTIFIGPKLQKEIFGLLIRFRTFAIAMTADVRQMYRQIWMQKEHRPFQRVLWRFNREEPVQAYELTTVAFGVKASPFLALRTLQQLSRDEAGRFPRAAKRVEQEIYMDDVICSISDVPSAIELYQQWVGMFRAGGFQLTKWATNSVELREQIPMENRRSGPVNFPTEVLTVLGLRWSPELDILKFAVEVQATKWSKRSVLSTMARIWDPLGLITPVTVAIKLLMKRLWNLSLGWDDPLPLDVLEDWRGFVSELPSLSKFCVPRHVGVGADNCIRLVGFADASERAYAAVVYALVEEGEAWKPQLLCAKAKVAPSTVMTIPRLELCAALLLAQLLQSVRTTYLGTVVIRNVVALSDSTVVLHWLQGSPHRWKTFVANRIVKIREYIPEANWGHVRSEDNPADCASRGLAPKLFLEEGLWRKGPPWLSQSQHSWPLNTSTSVPEKVDLEERQSQCFATVVKEPPLGGLIDRCGSWTKLLRVTIYLLRLGGRLARGGTMKASDFEAAELSLVKLVQRWYFSELIKELEAGKPVAKPIRVLTPFLQDGLVRVGGRLGNTSLRFTQKHPLLLPKEGNFTRLLITYIHVKYLHAGPTLVASLLRHKYWILGARDLVRHQLHRCITCFKCKPRITSPMMADLPLPRIDDVKPFNHTGVDFAGPFKLTLSRARGVRSTKGYFCLFICLATRAVHLEAASDLSTDCCLAALKRFIARRGPCATIYSDQGTNFVGAKRYLDELRKFLGSQELNRKIQEELSAQRVAWKLNPPAAPHFGGSWEAGVKSVKYHFTRVVGEQVLTFEEFSTILCQIEAVLNSRPLCWMSTDPADPVALTPAHFLTGAPLNECMAPETGVSLPLLKRKELLDNMVQNCWSRWRCEYLTSLQQRMKWNTPSCPVQPGLLVLVHQDNVPPLRWPLGRIEEIYPGKDGVVRVVSVKVKGSLFKRPVHKLAPLPCQ